MTELARLVRNTAFTGAAFLSAGIVGILLVPVLIGAYGIVAFGLLTLGRTLLPAGALALVDLGIGESAMQAVGRARGGGDWRTASEQVSLLLATSVVLGGVLALAMELSAPALAALFQVDVTMRAAFIEMLRVTAVSLVFLFPGVVLEGVVKGFERFGLLRLWETLATSGYAVVVVALAWTGQPFETAQYAFLAMMGVRYAAFMIGIGGEAKRAGLRLTRWSRSNTRYLQGRSVLFFHGKLTGALHTFAPPLVIGILVGPTGVGLYDVVTRVPRYLKPVLSIMASAIIPVAARFEGAGNSAQLREFGKAGLWLVPFIALPPLTGMMVHAEFILRAWVGPEYARYGDWLMVALFVPTLYAALQFGQAALQTQSGFLRSQNRLAAGIVIVQFALSLALVHWLGESAFILGQTVAIAAFFPANLQLLARAYGVPLRWVTTQLLGLVAPALLLAPVSLGVVQLIGDANGMVHLVAFGLWCLTYWAASYLLILGAAQQQFVRRVFDALAGHA